jgi:hypothetical protein
VLGVADKMQRASVCGLTRKSDATVSKEKAVTRLRDGFFDSWVTACYEEMVYYVVSY